MKTYYTIEFTDENTTWFHKEFEIGKYNSIIIAMYESFDKAQAVADFLLKTHPAIKYNIIKNIQEIVETKEKQPSLTKKEPSKVRDKIVFKIQFESRSIPHKWQDTDGEFINLLHAQMILDFNQKSWPDRTFRLVRREYFYQEEEVKN